MRAHSRWGRLVGLATILAGLGTAALATPQAATGAPDDAPRTTASTPADPASRQLFGTPRPSAIGLARDGTAYVGFPTGGRLQKVTIRGKARGTVRLDQDEAVNGLHVADGGIWVDYETSTSLISPRGRVLSQFPHEPLRTCDSSTPATRYGGITTGAGRVYVANRCADTLSVYTRRGDLLATVRLPGRPRGVAYGVAQSGRPATVYVAIPDRSQVLAFNAAALRDRSTPVSRYTMKRPRGGSKPAPGGLVVDAHGQLTVSDMANNALYLVNTNNKYSVYRVLGHPPRASRQGGRLNAPGALAQAPASAGGMAANYFVLDTNNSRVQRWSNGGYTYWVRSVRPPNGSGGSGGGGSGNGGSGGGGGSSTSAPQNTSRPTIVGTAAIGNTLTCLKGTWSGSGVTYDWQWRRDGVDIQLETEATYLVAAEDNGTELTCAITATNSKGSRTAFSRGITIGGGGSGPVNLSPPTITGTPTVGSTLTCTSGSWSGGVPIFGYQWRRDDVAISGATSSTRVVTVADAGTDLSCTVTATLTGGSTSMTSASVSISSGSGPVNTVLPSISGTALPGELLTCDRGTWTGSGLTYTYAWRRDGTIVGTGPTYTVVNADVGTDLTCSVTAISGSGSTTETSDPVTVSGPSGHAPTNTAAPVISGTPAVGQTLTCSQGTWTGTPTSYDYVWRRDGTTISGATASTYVVVVADAGTDLTCTVIATNGTGSGAQASAPVTVSSGAPPANTSLPTVSGSGAVGTALTCDKGTWTGAGITYTYGWNRNGAPVPDTAAATYVVLSADQTATLSCTVTATNGAGATLATSANRSIAAGPGAAPAVITAPAISGTVGTGETLSCSSGTWSNSPTSYATVWQRDGATIATGSTYDQVAADQGHALRCLVVATNASGKGAARSDSIGGVACSGAVGVVINNGAAETTNPAVQLSIRPPVGATQVVISNDASMAGATSYPISSGCTYAWTMDSIPGLPLTWSVYVQFDTDATTYSDSILIRQPAARLLHW